MCVCVCVHRSRHLGIDLRDVIAFGDQTNDIEMLTHAGTGVAMANAHKESVRAAADRVCVPRARAPPRPTACARSPVIALI